MVVLTSDTDHAESIVKRLHENNGYCPCRIVKTPETKCMCKEFKEQVDNGYIGLCHCGLYESISDYKVSKDKEVDPDQ